MSPNGVVLASRLSRRLSARLLAGLRAIAVLAIGIVFSATVSIAVAATTEADTDYILFHHHDALGSTVATTDEQGRVLWYENSNPYGESRGRHSAEGRALDPSASFGTTNERLDTERPPLGYAGHVRDGGSDLIYMQQRHYDPVLGRFLSNDPVGFQASNPMMFNRYAYANNNPYGFVDPDGRNAVTAFGGAIYETVERAFGVGDGRADYGNLGGALVDGYNGEGSGAWAAAGQDVVEIGGALTGTAFAGKIAARITGLFRKSEKTFEITDGVRRAKANELLGNKTVSANIRDAQGRLIEKKDLPIDSLRSPNKASIELNTREQFERFHSVQQGVRNGDSLPAIDVTPGSRGTSIPEIDFTP